MILLTESTSVGYPDEYLIARLRGRSKAYFSDWRGIAAGTAALAGQGVEGFPGFAALLRWCFQQMESSLREVFASLFFVIESRTIILCLRFIKSGDFPGIEALLQGSLLGSGLRRALLTERPIEQRLATLAAVLAAGNRHFAALPETAGRKGSLPLFEQHLTVAALNRLAAFPLPSVLRQFGRHLVDCRNLLAVNKFLRWQEEQPPLLAEGGFISPQKLRGAANPAELLRLAGLFPYGLDEKFPAERLEVKLAGFLASQLRRHRLSDDCTTQILFFLWQAYAEQRNRSLLYEGRRLDQALLLEELLY